MSYIFNFHKKSNRIFAFIILYFSFFLEYLVETFYSQNCISINNLGLQSGILNSIYFFIILISSLFSTVGVISISLFIFWLLKRTKFKSIQVETKNLLHITMCIYPIKCLISIVITIFFIILCFNQNLAFIDVYDLYNNVHMIFWIFSLIIIILLINKKLKILNKN